MPTELPGELRQLLRGIIGRSIESLLVQARADLDRYGVAALDDLAAILPLISRLGWTAPTEGAPDPPLTLASPIQRDLLRPLAYAKMTPLGVETSEAETLLDALGWKLEGAAWSRPPVDEAVG